MAPPPGTMRVSRYFTALGVVLGLLYLLVLLPGNANTPKLGIDLVGGIRVIFTAVPPAGKTVTSTSMEQARQIIEDRINYTGVTASTVQIQGDDQLVVSIPGGTDTDVQRLGQAAQLNFRPVIAPAIPNSCISSSGKGSGSASPSGSSSPSVGNSPSSAQGASAGPSGAASSGARSTSAAPSGSNAPNGLNQRPLTAPTSASATASPSGTATRGAATPTGTASGTATPSAPASQAPQPCVFNAVGKLAASAKITIPTTEAGFTKLSQTQQQQIAAALATTDCDQTNRVDDNPKSYYVACGDLGGQRYAYLLGTVIIRGTQVTEANAIAPSTGQGGSQQWTVSLTLNDSGQTAWGNWTTAHNTGKQDGSPQQCGTAAGGLPCNDFVAFTLDGNVVSAPATNEPIIGQATQVSGNFTPDEAKTLANQLKFGALPLSFNTDSNERVSASLGVSQLNAALLAGGIGLVLVVIYSLLYYRGLGLVTIASLVVSGLLTYAMLVILGQQIGFTLDLAGIAGLIVALGITADSFVVFFERIKDEVHEGRSVRVAVPRGWVRARRTVISADIVSFLAAIILYIFASADVKGFAFTLGLSTILDLFVVVVFTHPMVALLSRSKAFGSPRFTGLNSVRVGGITPDKDEPKAKGAAARAAQRRSSTVVLDKDDEPADDPATGTDAVDDTADEAPRRRSNPQGGTAAERAAARRARQREQRDEKGDL